MEIKKDDNLDDEKFDDDDELEDEEQPLHIKCRKPKKA